MHKIVHLFTKPMKDFASFNYAERRGIALLVLIILLIEGVNAFLPEKEDIVSFDPEMFSKEIRIFEESLAMPDTNELIKEKRSSAIKTYPGRYNKKVTAAAKPPMIIEINTADSAKLVSLPGIGPVYAGRILKYRGLLGGYFSCEQLLEVYGMDSSRYAGISEYITQDASLLSKIAINEADFKTLLRHPYLDYETVKQIVNYRKYNGTIPNTDTLKAVIAYDPMYEKVKHYIEY